MGPGRLQGKKWGERVGRLVKSPDIAAEGSAGDAGKGSLDQSRPGIPGGR